MRALRLTCGKFLRAGNMAKRVSCDELTWLVTDAFNAVYRSQQSRISVAIVADKSCGWRAVIANRTRAHISPELDREKSNRGCGRTTD